MKKLSPSVLGAGERRARSRLHQLLSGAEGMLHGSLIEMKRRCGKPNCRCARDESARHRSLYLGQTRKGRTRMIYIPRDLEQTVRQWVENHRLASELLESISQEAWRRIEQAKKQTKPEGRAAKAPGRGGAPEGQPR